MTRCIVILAWVLPLILPTVASASHQAGDLPIRVATFNIEDAATTDLLVNDQPRLQRLAEVIQRLRPNIVLLNEIAYDYHGVPGVPMDEPEGSNARRFVDHYLTVSQAEGLEPIRYRAIMLPSNTGRASGLTSTTAVEP